MSTFSPHVTVATVVEHDQRFLLVEEWIAGRLVYNQPAGHVEAGEDLLDAALRETQEESGWLVEVQGIVGLSLSRVPINGVSYMRTTFFATPLHRVQTTLDEGIERVVWLTPDEMRASSDKMRSPVVLASVEQYLNGQRFPLSLIF